MKQPQLNQHSYDRQRSLVAPPHAGLIPLLPDWLSRGMADLFPAGDPSDADQALAARLAQAEKKAGRCG